MKYLFTILAVIIFTGCDYERDQPDESVMFCEQLTNVSGGDIGACIKEFENSDPLCQQAYTANINCIKAAYPYQQCLTFPDDWFADLCGNMVNF